MLSWNRGRERKGYGHACRNYYQPSKGEKMILDLLPNEIKMLNKMIGNSLMIGNKLTGIIEFPKNLLIDLSIISEKINRRIIELTIAEIAIVGVLITIYQSSIRAMGDIDVIDVEFLNQRLVDIFDSQKKTL